MKKIRKFEEPLILGISCFYHDSAAVLCANGEIISAAQEERFSRKKFDDSFPEHAVNYCLESACIEPAELGCIAFYDEPLVKLDRIIETQTRFAPAKVFRNYRRVYEWITQKFSVEKLIFQVLPGFKGEVFFSHHHMSHAASAFFPSPFERAGVVVVDAMGEWSCTSIGIGQENRVEILKEQRFPHSVGLLYSAITQHLGFKVNSGEYKVMGLAPYGEPRFVQTIKDNLVDIRDDGAIALNTDYFDFMVGHRMTNHRLEQLFGAPDREPEGPLTQREMDIAKSIQVVVEEIMMKITRHAVSLTGQKTLVMAGGVALNCVANGKIQRSGLVEQLWVQPAAGDAGGALGAALSANYMVFRKRRLVDGRSDTQKGSFLGPSFSREDVVTILEAYGFVYETLNDDRFDRISNLIIEGKVIGMFQGGMEFGPRALGARSIIGDARNPGMQKHMNLKIKYRESFRPFAPIVLAEEVSSWFDGLTDSPYMLFTVEVNDERTRGFPGDRTSACGLDRINVPRSEIPAVTHVDRSARIQTVDRQRNPFIHQLLRTFQKKTDCPVLINTSFNIRGEPIVCTPLDALMCFMNTEMDCLCFEWFLLEKNNQQNQLKDENFVTRRELD